LTSNKISLFHERRELKFWRQMLIRDADGIWEGNSTITGSSSAWSEA